MPAELILVKDKIYKVFYLLVFTFRGKTCHAVDDGPMKTRRQSIPFITLASQLFEYAVDFAVYCFKGLLVKFARRTEQSLCKLSEEAKKESRLLTLKAPSQQNSMFSSRSFNLSSKADRSAHHSDRMLLDWLAI